MIFFAAMLPRGRLSYYWTVNETLILAQWAQHQRSFWRQVSPSHLGARHQKWRCDVALWCHARQESSRGPTDCTFSQAVAPSNRTAVEWKRIQIFTWTLRYSRFGEAWAVSPTSGLKDSRSLWFMNLLFVKTTAEDWEGKANGLSSTRCIYYHESIVTMSLLFQA